MNVSKNAISGKVDRLDAGRGILVLGRPAKFSQEKLRLLLQDEAFEAIDPETQPEIGTNEAAGIEASARQAIPQKRGVKPRALRSYPFFNLQAPELLVALEAQELRRRRT